MSHDDRHRGPDPRDRELFGPERLGRLRAACADLVWLLNRGYAVGAATKLVGDRYQLHARQRSALRRGVCTDAALARRATRRIGPEALAGAELVVDGFNVLATVEAALGGAVLLLCRDGCLRDIGGLHGSYKRVAETAASLLAIGRYLEAVGTRSCAWLFDSPVSNSGRLKADVERLAGERGWNWSVRLELDPDRLLKGESRCVATADSAILDACSSWLNLTGEVVAGIGVGPWIVDLFPDAEIRE